ncbi:MAG: glycoside hydrolase family 97 protein [Acidobacteria bacterium]|nr:glycoside hydrolase family 97 protein [Acidobacteriota bacterium]
MRKRIHRNSKAAWLAVCSLMFFVFQGCATRRLTLNSPSGDLKIGFKIRSNPQPYLRGMRAYYSVSYKGRPILRDSPLGIEFKGAPPLDRDFEIVGTQRESQDHTWDWAFGGESRIRDHYNQLTVSLRETRQPHRRLDVVLRAYDTGMAFRYVLPQQTSLGKFTIANEETGFYFARPGSAYALEVGSFNNNYEGEFRHINISDLPPMSLVGLPLTLHLDGGPWIALLEADLNDYAGLYVHRAFGVRRALQGKLVPLPDHLDEAVIGETPKSTPWRVLLVAPRAGGLIEASEPMVLNLSQPSQISDTSWIHPGKTSWDWWSGDYAKDVSFKPGMNTATMEHYIDFSARAHLPYMLLDAGWSPDYGGVCSKLKPGASTVPNLDWCVENDITRWIPQVNIPEILKYAKQRNVKVLLWIHWTAAAKQMDKAFPLYEKWGVAGVKVDFMGGIPDDQNTVNLYRKIVSTAARYHLLVDIHGAYKPTGLRRAYPNLITREGVMGMEYDKWSRRATPRHNVTIPFTRMLAGPMDYTPGCFHNATREQFHPQRIQPMCQGTRANQLAMYVVYLSPLQMLSDYPEDYLGQPGFEFLEKVPTVWDETKVLNGEPGEYVTIARRRGSDWYLGSMTNWTPRDLNIPLDFLGGGQWNAEIFADGPNADQDATSLAVSTRRVTSKDNLAAHLASGGGLAVIFSPAQ